MKKKIQKKGGGQIFSHHNHNHSSCNIPLHLDRIHTEFTQEEIEEWIHGYHVNKDENMYFQDFLRNQLPILQLPTNICRKYKKNYVLSCHGDEEKLKTYRNFMIPENVYIISLEKKGSLPIDYTFEYIMKRMMIGNQINEMYFRALDMSISKIELDMVLRKVNQNDIQNHYEPKYYKIYKPGERFTNYSLSSEEKKEFMTGLWKLPIKESIYENDEILYDSDTLKELIMNPYENRSNMINVSIQNPTNEMVRKIEDIIRPHDYEHRYYIEENDYYTFHTNYLQRLKEKFGNKTKKMNSIEDLCEIKTSKNKRKQKKIKLKYLIENLSFKERPNQENPLVFIVNFCTEGIINSNYQQNKYYRLNNQNESSGAEYSNSSINENENENRKVNEYKKNKMKNRKIIKIKK